MQVIKRDGSSQPLDIDRIHKVLEWACENLSNVSVSEIELKSQIQFYNGIKTRDIHESMIKAAADLITEDTPNYQYVAGRLINYHLRKEVYNGFEPIHIHEHWNNIFKIGYYDSILNDQYSKEEWDELNKYINHDRDFLLVYAAMEQMRGKYLVKNRITNQIFETPQMAYMLIAMTIFQNYNQKIRLKWVKDLYDALSTFDISFPTPIMAGVRTPQRQYSSCTLIESDDSLDSINATTSSIVKYVSQRAGIGIGGGRIRALNSPVRNGDTYHTGVIPFYKLWSAAINSCSQGSIRKGSGTLNVPVWHLEIEDIVVLKNNKGTEENRIRQLDYCIHLNKIFYERFLENKNITLFCPNDVPDLYDAFYSDDVDKFKNLYEKYERSYSIRKKVVSASSLFTTIMQERKDTGRIYLMNADHVNEHGSYYPAIKMTNLCVEITQCTKPLNDINDPDGEIALCTLSAINMGKIRKPEDFEKPCTLAVRALDEILDLQDYPILAAANHTRKYRPLGIGIINLAFWLAKNDTNYSNPDLDLIHKYAEAYSYYLIRASVDLAKEKGPCEAYQNVKYSDGIMPIHTYKKDVNNLAKPVYNMDWSGLIQDATVYKIRNATLMAGMPSETSSQISNATNSFEAPRSLVSVKQSRDGVLKQVVPSIHKYKNKYELLWDIDNPEGYLKICAVWQKFMDQSISVNTSYNPSKYEDNEIPLSELIKHVLVAYKYGIKTLYYMNTLDLAGDEDQEEECESCVI